MIKPSIETLPSFPKVVFPFAFFSIQAQILRITWDPLSTLASFQIQSVITQTPRSGVCTMLGSLSVTAIPIMTLLSLHLPVLPVLVPCISLFSLYLSPCFLSFINSYPASTLACIFFNLLKSFQCLEPFRDPMAF